MRKTHKIKLMPRPRQARWMARQSGYERWARNRMVAYFNERLCGTHLSAMDLRKMVRADARSELSWNDDLSALGIENAYESVKVALKAWANGKQANRAPRFKKRSHRATFGASDGHWDRSRVVDRRVRIPSLGWVRMREELRFDGRIVKMRCVREPSGWFVAITVDLGVEPRPTRRRRVVDVGVRTLACTSDGDAYPNPRALTGALRELRAVQKAIARSRKVHGPNQALNRRLKLYARLRVLHARVAHIRKNARRHIAAAVAKSCGRVVVETLNVSGMLKNRRLSRAISDAGLGALIAAIEWQCAKRGVAFEKRDQCFASSRICARCGWRNAGLTLGDKTFRCRSCAWEVERDFNAALNIRHGPASGQSVESTPVQLRLDLGEEAQIPAAIIR